MATSLETVPETEQLAPSSSSSSLPAPAAAAASSAVRAALAESSTSTPVSSPRLRTDSSSLGGDDSVEEGEITGTSSGGEIEKQRAGPHDPDALVTVFSDPLSFNVKHPLYSTWTLWFDNASKADKAKSWDEQLQQVMEVNSVEEFWGCDLVSPFAVHRTRLSARRTSRLYNNIVPPSHIQANSNYYLFKQGIKRASPSLPSPRQVLTVITAAWEDPSNNKGGKWSVQVPREKSRAQIDKWWLYMVRPPHPLPEPSRAHPHRRQMLAAIGETFETPFTSAGSPAEPMTFTDEVTGVIVSSRRAFYRLSIWTRTADSRPRAENVGRHFKYGVLGMNEGKKYGGSSGGIQSDCEFQSHADSQSQSRKKSYITGPSTPPPSSSAPF